MKTYIIGEDLLKEAIGGLQKFGGVAVEITVEKLQNLEEKDVFEDKTFWIKTYEKSI
jgi:hypothetical protein